MEKANKALISGAPSQGGLDIEAFRRVYDNRMTNRLVEIQRKDLSVLCDLYIQSGTKNYISYTTIDNYIRWFQQDPNVKHIKVFCLNGDFSDGTFVITDRCSAYVDTLNDSHENVIQLLRLIDYSKGYVFLSVRAELHTVVTETLKNANVEIASDESTLLYYLPKEDALKFDTNSEEVELRSITQLTDLEKTNAAWVYGSPIALPHIQRIAKYNPNVGAFKADGTLVAWIFRIQTGLLGQLHTDENYVRRGYGSLVVRNISKKIAEMGHDIYAGIFETNTPSRSLFSKCGFKSVGEVHWITTKITWSLADE